MTSCQFVFKTMTELHNFNQLLNRFKIQQIQHNIHSHPEQPVKVRDLEICLKQFIKTSKQVQNINLSQLQIIFKFLLLVIRTCKEVVVIQLCMNNDQSHKDNVFFTDSAFVIFELHKVLERRCLCGR